MPRALWKGAISFGLVHIPVSLYPASQSHGLSFDLVDKRDFAPVGYKRYNKRTGDEIAREHIVKGYEYAKGEYVVITDEDFKQANVKATQTVEIVAFVDAAAVAPHYFESPYYLEPGKRGEKGYVLLREVLKRTGRIGVANVVIRSRQHLAAVIPVGEALVLDTLRWATELRPVNELDLPAMGQGDVSEKELAMAERLVEDMTEEWDPAQYRDTYSDDLLVRIEQRIKAGQTHAVAPAGEEGDKPRRGAEVIDLVSMLRRSLEQKGQVADEVRGAAERPRRAAARKPAARLTRRKTGAQKKRA